MLAISLKFPSRKLIISYAILQYFKLLSATFLSIFLTFLLVQILSHEAKKAKAPVWKLIIHVTSEADESRKTELAIFFRIEWFLCGFRNKIFIASSVGNEKKMGDINESSSTMLRRKSDDIQFHPSEIKLSSLLIVCLGMKCNEIVDENDFFRL